MPGASYADRHSLPVTLADQIVAWTLHREGLLISEIAQRLRRFPRETRDILFGGTTDV